MIQKFSQFPLLGSHKSRNQKTSHQPVQNTEAELSIYDLINQARSVRHLSNSSTADRAVNFKEFMVKVRHNYYNLVYFFIRVVDPIQVTELDQYSGMFYLMQQVISFMHLINSLDRWETFVTSYLSDTLVMNLLISSFKDSLDLAMRCTRSYFKGSQNNANPAFRVQKTYKQPIKIVKHPFKQNVSKISL